MKCNPPIFIPNELYIHKATEYLIYKFHEFFFSFQNIKNLELGQ